MRNFLTTVILFFRRTTANAQSFVFSALCLLAGAVLIAGRQNQPPQPPVFRGGVDVVAVDVQVIDRDGVPIAHLGANDFTVWINGHPRQVVSVDLIDYSQTATGPARSAAPAAPLAVMTRGDARDVTRRVIVLAVDESSFTGTSWQAAKQAAGRFLDRLPPEVLAGLYVFPFNEPKLELTHDHAAVRRALDGVVGRYEALSGKFYIGPSELIDICARDGQVLAQVVSRECPRGDRGCPSQVALEAAQKARWLEALATQSVGAFRTLAEGLSTLPGRKTVGLLSQRLIASDRVAGCPDIKGLLLSVSRAIAAADANLYVLHIDDSFLETFSAARPSSADASGRFINGMRDERAQAHGLERLAGEAGGSYVQVTAGTADRAFDRMLRETAAYYLLGVNTEPSDRDGERHFVRVAVTAKGASVHNRTEVIIPKATVR